MNRKKARVKVYGTDSTKEVRARMIEILYERVSLHKDKFISPILHHELETLEVDKHGKVQAISPNHDDQIFSYLHALRVWYEGEDLANRYGIRKNTIKTDEDVEIESDTLERETELENLDFNQISSDDSDPIIQQQKQFFAQATAAKLMPDYNKNSYENEQRDFEIALNMNRPLKEAYAKKYNIDIDSMQQTTSFVDMPDDIYGAVFDDDDDVRARKQLELHGNLFSTFNNIN